jgi:hypothetical protein
MLADLLAPTGLGTAARLGIGAADSLPLDKLLKGWRPGHFIEGTAEAVRRHELIKIRTVALAN